MRHLKLRTLDASKNARSITILLHLKTNSIKQEKTQRSVQNILLKIRFLKYQNFQPIPKEANSKRSAAKGQFEKFNTNI